MRRTGINLRKKVQQKCVTKEQTGRNKTDIFLSNPSGIQSMNCQDKSKAKIRHIILTKYNVAIILQLVLGHLKDEIYPPVNT